MRTRREARLRPEHARYYPFITPGAWESATVICEEVMAYRVRYQRSAAPEGKRVLDPEHFEFRDSPHCSDSISQLVSRAR